MKKALVQFTAWERPQEFGLGEVSAEAGDLVIAKTEFGSELGRVAEVVDMPDETEQGQLLERLATAEDLEASKKNNGSRNKTEAMDYCRKIVKRHGLKMKLVDCHFSFDDSRLIFAFIADGRIDFRGAVKELNKHFQRSVRLYQLGVRDEARAIGDIGSCGESLCCRGHLKALGNVSSELAETQQIAHRGPERLSGVCGRLKCCLAYEAELYESLAKKLPPLGAKIKTKHGRGEVVGWHILRQSVDVRIEPDDKSKGIVVEEPIK